MASEVVDADAAAGVELEAGGWCEELEVRLVEAEEVPFDEAAAAAG
jgi:hypothetical protein